MILNNYLDYLRTVGNVMFENVDAANYKCNILTGMINISGNSQLILKGYTRYYTGGNFQQHINEVFEQLIFRSGTSIIISESDNSITPNTYSLDNVATFTSQTFANGITVQDGKTKLQFIYSGVNTTGSTVSVRKIGVAKKFYRIGDSVDYTVSSASQVSVAENVLMFVYELSEPVMVENGRTFAFTFEIDTGE